MLSLETTTERSTDEVIAQASDYFGEQLGLAEHRLPHGVEFRGGGGFVSLQLEDSDDGLVVALTTREWEAPVRDFATQIA